jgi:HEPN domain-containing protein
MATIKDAKIISDAIVKAINPVSISIFGSCAKYGSGEDLDLLIIFDDTIESSGDINLIIHKCLKTYYKDFAIDPFIIPASLFKEYYLRGSPFLRLILREGRPLYMRGVLEEWFKQAEDELKMAVYLLDGGFFRGSCLHSQQCIEKSIKARLLKEGWELERIHSIERLISIGEKYNIQIGLSDEEVVFIDNIYKGRYPAESGLLPFGEPSGSDADKAANLAKRIFEEMKIF